MHNNLQKLLDLIVKHSGELSREISDYLSKQEVGENMLSFINEHEYIMITECIHENEYVLLLVVASLINMFYMWIPC